MNRSSAVPETARVTIRSVIAAVTDRLGLTLTVNLNMTYLNVIALVSTENSVLSCVVSCS